MWLIREVENVESAKITEAEFQNNVIDNSRKKSLLTAKKCQICK